MDDFIALDTSYIIGFIDERDLWNVKAIELRDALVASNKQILVFDCVLSEAISTLARRLHEKRRSGNVLELLTRLEQEFPKSKLTWIYRDLEQHYDSVVALIKETEGELNFNDALIAISCRERKILLLASFDPDFDRIAWLTRVSKPSDLQKPAAPNPTSEPDA